MNISRAPSGSKSPQSTDQAQQSSSLQVAKGASTSPGGSPAKKMKKEEQGNTFS